MQVTLNLTESQWNALRELLEQLPQKFTVQPAVPLQERILGAIQRNGTIPPWKLKRVTNAAPVCFDAVLNELLENGTIEFVREQGRGRPAIGYRKVKTCHE